MTSPRRLADLAALAGATLAGDGGIAVERVSSVEDAAPGALTFAVDEKWVARALASPASAVIVPRSAHAIERGAKTLLLADDVRAALAAILASFASPLPHGEFTHSSAVIEEGVTRGADVWIGAGAVVGSGARLGDGAILLPGAYVGARAAIGKRTLLHPRACVLDDCVVGDDCILHANCVIGADGFGFVRVGREQIKIPQLGNVVVGDRVEIGACSAIDRAVTGSTTIGSGTKIDNLVQVGHNCSIGADSTLCAQVGIAGSTDVGAIVTLAGQVGVNGHIKIGDMTIAGGQTGITSDLPPNSKVWGTPALPIREEMAQKVMFRKLPKLFEQVRDLMDAVAELRKRR
ncbi:MAG: UDP-3-O-(3-hydroxymyristoyl)glucosamine N-acyltransferase [Candidatus Eremiobacteraeota bacterium]|nr:UDP-3-O-(3-hydroxymyristoyl)glucosamine N-acyltransferase [Candidatus Eremiobacteraeota bacterium]